MGFQLHCTYLINFSGVYLQLTLVGLKSLLVWDDGKAQIGLTCV